MSFTYTLDKRVSHCVFLREMRKHNEKPAGTSVVLVEFAEFFEKEEWKMVGC